MSYFGISHVLCSNNGDSGIFSVGSSLVTVALISIEATSMGEVIPLHTAGVLEFIDHYVPDIGTDFLEYE